MKKLLLIMSAVFLSGSSYAGVSGSVGVDFSENAADNVVATKDIDLDISSDVGFASIAVITNASDELVLDEYALGVNTQTVLSVMVTKVISSSVVVWKK